MRLRTRGMEREGFIKYYQVIPNLSLFELPLIRPHGFRAPDPICKLRALEEFSQADGVIHITNFLGESFGVTIAASSEVDVQQRIQNGVAFDTPDLTPSTL